ncbi:MAG: polysaccharide biosynthesis protein [Nitrospirota bacterium]|nr:polysaccharide biosynthesis protein [Nitrospirota bacterium]
MLFNKRRLLVFAVDLLSIMAAFSLSFMLRFDFRLPPEMKELFLKGFYVIIVVKPAIFLISGLYRNIWRYASLQDAIEIFKVVTISSIISIFATEYIRHFAPYPRSIFILDWFLLFFMVSSSRLLWRIYRETYIIPQKGRGKRTLIVGAGEAGSLLLKEIRRQPSSIYHIVGFLDNEHGRRGMRLHGVPVLGEIKHVKAIVRKYKIESVIIAIPSAKGKLLRDIVDRCKEAKISFKTVPTLGDLIDGKVSVSQIKDVEIEDLLGREPVVLNEIAIGAYLADKKVLVTGAGGSIGSEICRQVARFKPGKIVLVDNAETPLYNIEKDLRNTFPDLLLTPVIADIRDEARIEKIFKKFTPEVIFHAAAYKHVPMMEYNPVEAVSNNIKATKVLADAAHRFKVINFVMISTDKAVNPTNVMGASKRIAEIYVQALSQQSSTKYTTVRFGNVLGSNGSVIPLFKQQIKSGGPVTVTDPQVIRYFMTVQEAAELVLQAGCIGNGGEIFVLDMGEPVRIVDLAEELIRLSGLVPYEDIDIVFTGLRPGEKLFEELLISGEDIKPTVHEKIKVATAVGLMDPAHLDQELETLFQKAKLSNIAGIIKGLRNLVPEFVPAYNLEKPVTHAFRRARPDLFVEAGDDKSFIRLVSNNKRA